MKLKQKTLLMYAGIGALALTTACASGSKERSGVPDEFRVVKKAPLTVPPEYSLRPPERGTVDCHRRCTSASYHQTRGHFVPPPQR